LHDKPAIKVELKNLKLEPYPNSVILTLDTGFEGSILLPRNMYEFFQVAELPRKFWRTYISLAGRITMRVSRAILSIEPNFEEEVYVETPEYGPGTKLIGRELLNMFPIILDGPKKQVCMVKSASH